MGAQVSCESRVYDEYGPVVSSTKYVEYELLVQCIGQPVYRLPEERCPAKRQQLRDFLPAPYWSRYDCQLGSASSSLWKPNTFNKLHLRHPTRLILEFSHVPDGARSETVQSPSPSKTRSAPPRKGLEDLNNPGSVCIGGPWVPHPGLALSNMPQQCFDPIIDRLSTRSR